MEYGIPLADRTKTPSMPSLSTPPNAAPAQPAIGAEAEKKAREGQQFAWAPNQSVQAEGISGTRDDEFRSRAARVAINQAVEQTKAQTEVVKGQITVVENEIAQLNAQISELNSQISSLNSQASSVEGQIGQVQAQAAQAQAQVVVSASPVAAQPSAPAYDQVADIQARNARIREGDALEASQAFQSLKAYALGAGLSKIQDAAQRAQSYFQANPNMTPEQRQAKSDEFLQAVGGGRFDATNMEYDRVRREIDRLRS